MLKCKEKKSWRSGAQVQRHLEQHPRRDDRCPQESACFVICSSQLALLTKKVNVPDFSKFLLKDAVRGVTSKQRTRLLPSEMRHESSTFGMCAKWFGNDRISDGKNMQARTRPHQREKKVLPCQPHAGLQLPPHGTSRFMSFQPPSWHDYF